MMNYMSKRSSLIIFILVSCLAVLPFSSCTLNRPGNSHRIPGNKREFNPAASYEKVHKFAGKNTELVSITAYMVKSDGTMDFKAEYNTAAIYTFYRPVQIEDVKKGGPLGSGIKEVKRSYTAEKVIVSVSKPHFYTETINNGEPTTIYDPGMNKYSAFNNDDYSGDIIDPPALTFDRLWNPALRRGIPADAVAVITCDKKGYTFRINDTDINFLFDGDGELLEE
ncbi:MAG: hypothetical protein E4H36_08365 [Spirochaetales bacterium]|nr:MAG: hypothetical protein E4H36_08365 [Spirochaetales bacterium]